MSQDEIDTAMRIIDLCRERGVKSFDCGGLRFELGPPVDTTPAAKPGMDPDVCRCGHPTYQHDASGLCVAGCEPLRCLDPDVVAKADKEA